MAGAAAVTAAARMTAIGGDGGSCGGGEGGGSGRGEGGYSGMAPLRVVSA
jgi:hypothetical protein